MSWRDELAFLAAALAILFGGMALGATIVIVHRTATVAPATDGALDLSDDHPVNP